MKSQIREEPRILAAAERSMHAWALAREQQDRTTRRDTEHDASRRAIRYIAISREAGAGGSEIGRRVGRQLGWRVFDKNLLDCIADRFGLPRMMLDLVDETRSSWVYDVLGTWMDSQLVPHAKFVACLSREVVLAAREGPAVFVGRGAQFLLPRQEVLAVRLVASPKYRVGQIMAQQGLDENDARRLMEELDHGRGELCWKFFHRDVADPHLYDLVVNVERRGKDQAVKEILAAVEAPAAVAEKP